MMDPLMLAIAIASVCIAWPRIPLAAFALFGGPWGNPFVVGEAGTRPYCIALFRDLLNGEFAASHRAPLEAQRIFVEHAAGHWKTIKGKNLACWCSISSACHGDVLLELASRPTLCEAL